MLQIKNLHATVGGKAILKGPELTVRPGEVHAIMGPNGSGKSTLANVLAGREDYEITGGSASFDGQGPRASRATRIRISSRSPGERLSESV